MSCVPLLFYTVIAVENKGNISRRDWIILSSVSLGMLLGCSLQFCTSFSGAMLLIIIALTSVGLALVLLILGDRDNGVGQKDYSQSEFGSYSSSVKTRKKLAWQLLCFFPSFPIVYFLSLRRIISHDMTVVLFMVCNISTKIIFVAILMAAHVEVLYMLFIAETHLNASKRAFLRYVMHEVRVPLSSITMGIGLLEESDHITDEERESLMMMKGATCFMQETLNDVLCMQKIEEGKLELCYVPFPVADVVRVVESALKGSLSQKRIQLYTMVNEDVPAFVRGDRFRIEHVLANLLSNAIKFSPHHGSIFVTVSLVTRTDSKTNSNRKSHFRRSLRNAAQSLELETSLAGGLLPSIWTDHNREVSNLTCKLKFAVRDQGPGLSVEDQKMLFQDFVQIRPGEMQKGGGTGVGLSLCKQIVELHGGIIRCDSEPGLGATFSFIIPFQIHTTALTNAVEEEEAEIKVTEYSVHEQDQLGSLAPLRHHEHSSNPSAKYLLQHGDGDGDGDGLFDDNVSREMRREGRSFSEVTAADVNGTKLEDVRKRRSEKDELASTRLQEVEDGISGIGNHTGGNSRSGSARYSSRSGSSIMIRLNDSRKNSELCGRMLLVDGESC